MIISGEVSGTIRKLNEDYISKIAKGYLQLNAVAHVY